MNFLSRLVNSMIKKIIFFVVIAKTMLITACSNNMTTPPTDLEQYKQLCDAGSGENCNKMATIYMNKGQRAAAAWLYNKACKLGSQESCSHSRKVNNINISANSECNSGNSCFTYGNTYYGNHDYGKARDYYEKSCSFDYGDGCWKIGYLYDLGEGGVKDEATAISYYQKACSLNHAIACISIGNHYAYRKEEPKNFQEALKFYKIACDIGNEIGCTSYDDLALNFQNIRCNSGSTCFDIGDYYFNDDDYPKAKFFYEQSCRLDYGDGCLNLGYLYDKGLGVKQNDVSANLYYRKACSYNNAIACYNLGNQYANGKGEPKNYHESLTFYKKSCDLGNENGCTNYKNVTAYLNDKSDNTQKNNCQNGNECLTKGTQYRDEGNFSQAGVYYGHACDFKNGSGCNKLGLLFEEGVGGYQQNFDKAAHYFAMACNFSEANGCNNLASLYEEGRGVTQDIFRAKTLYEKSCHLKNASGCFNLGHMYENAIGTRQNLIKAKESYGLSCDYGFQQGCDAHKRQNK